MRKFWYNYSPHLLLVVMLKNFLRNWLGIVEPKDWSWQFEAWEKSVNKITKDLEHDLWKVQQVVKPVVMGKCVKCKKKFRLWPYEEAGYYINVDGKGGMEHYKCHNNKAGRLR